MTDTSLRGLIRPFLERPGSAGVFVDFDGTLAPIVEDPEDARPVSGSSELLARLADRFSKVAVISGRPVAYLAENLAGAGSTELIGLYGLERQLPGSTEVQVPAEADRWRQAVESVAAAADREVGRDPERFRGFGVERKGLSVTLHYRNATGLAGWAESFAAQQADATGLVAHQGKMSVELRPPVDTDKGTVVADLASGLAAACYFGDDLGDVPAFDALDRLRADGVATLAVAVRSGIGDETPPAVLEAADIVVEGPEGAMEVLRALAGEGVGKEDEL
jgi:trehalose 6-phosphate phosphatase